MPFKQRTFKRQVLEVMRAREPQPLWRYGGRHRQEVLSHFVFCLAKTSLSGIEDLQKMLHQCYIEFYDECAGDRDMYKQMSKEIWKLLSVN